jgi:hypothetical protein
VEKKERKILIITDSGASIGQMAVDIAAIIEAKGYSAPITEAGAFSAVNLLPTYAFFLGCETQKPSSFSYLETLLAHISLPGRICGVFSSNAGALKYLSSLIKDSEAVIDKPFLAKKGTANRDELQNWIQGILKAE